MTNQLKTAVAAAFETARREIDDDEIEVVNHLMAQKYEHDDGLVEWVVRMSDSFDRDEMTHLSSFIVDCAGTEDEVAARILEMWDDDWTEIPRDAEHPVTGGWVQSGEVE